MKNERIRDMVLDFILESKKVLMILDDFDGSKLNKILVSDVDPFDKKTREVFLANVLRSDFLPDWKKIIVTRPFHLDKIYEIQEPELILNVLGFDSQSLKQILERQNIPWIFDFPRISCDLQSFCFVPEVFNLLAKSKIQYFEINSYTTDIFSFLFLNFFKKLNNQHTMTLKQLAEFSWSLLSDRNKLQMCFKDNQLKLSGGLNENYMSCFFISIPDSPLIDLDDFDYKFHFSHILMQEFLLALRVIMLPNNEFQDFFNFAIDNERFFMVVRFLFGFYNVRSGVRYTIEKEFSESIANFEQNKEDLKGLFQGKKKKICLCNSLNDDLLYRYKIFEDEMNQDLENLDLNYHNEFG